MSWIPEVIFIVTAPSCDSKGDRQPFSAPSRAAGTLLVVGSSGGNVTEHHGLELTDVYAGLHCCGDTQEVDGIHERVLMVQAFSLEESLSFRGGITVGLAGQLLTVKSERLRRSRE